MYQHDISLLLHMKLTMVDHKCVGTKQKRKKKIKKTVPNEVAKDMQQKKHTRLCGIVASYCAYSIHVSNVESTTVCCQFENNAMDRAQPGLAIPVIRYKFPHQHKSHNDSMQHAHCHRTSTATKLLPIIVVQKRSKPPAHTPTAHTFLHHNGQEQ